MPILEVKGGIGGQVLTILKEKADTHTNVMEEIQEIQNKLHYAGDYLQYDELYKLNVQLEILNKVYNENAVKKDNNKEFEELITNRIQALERNVEIAKLAEKPFYEYTCQIIALGGLLNEIRTNKKP